MNFCASRRGEKHLFLSLFPEEPDAPRVSFHVLVQGALRTAEGGQETSSAPALPDRGKGKVFFSGKPSSLLPAPDDEPATSYRDPVPATESEMESFFELGRWLEGIHLAL